MKFRVVRGDEGAGHWLICDSPFAAVRLRGRKARGWCEIADSRLQISHGVTVERCNAGTVSVKFRVVRGDEDAGHSLTCNSPLAAVPLRGRTVDGEAGGEKMGTRVVRGLRVIDEFRGPTPRASFPSFELPGHWFAAPFLTRRTIVGTFRVMAYSLAKENEQFIERMVRQGRFHSQSEVVREALRQMERAENSYLNPPPLSPSEVRECFASDSVEDAKDHAIVTATQKARRRRLGKQVRRVEDL